MRYQVPQFIEVEDKIFGPLTLKQFIYLAGGAGLSFVIYTLLPFFIAIILIVIVMGFSAALAFFKVNNKPFINVVESAFKYYLSSKLYIWKKTNRIADQKPATATDKGYQTIMVPKISDSKLKDLTWSLDIKESIYNNYTNKKDR
jgi:hypothetical protein